jgi:hypothetical protein
MKEGFRTCSRKIEVRGSVSSFGEQLVFGVWGEQEFLSHPDYAVSGELFNRAVTIEKKMKNPLIAST